MDVRISLSIACLAISDRSANLNNFWIRSIRKHFWPFQIDTKWRPFWMSENHVRSHFWPFQIYRPFLMSEIHFRSHFWPFQIDTELFLLTKWPPAAILDGTTMSIIDLVRDIWMSNACVKYEERSLHSSKVIALTSKLCGGGCGTDENIIFPKTCVSREYDNSVLLSADKCETSSISL